MIKINGVKWKIKIVSPFHPALLTPRGNLAYGCCDDKKKTIYLSALLNHKMMKQTLCHEITHASMYSYDIDLSHEENELVAEIISLYGPEIISLTNSSYKKLK